MYQRYFLIGLLVFMLGGCASWSINYARRLAGPGHPDKYYEGFSSGCDSVYGWINYLMNPRDKIAYETDMAYNSGWNDGRNICYEKELKLKMQMALDKYLYEKKQ